MADAKSSVIVEFGADTKKAEAELKAFAAAAQKAADKAARDEEKADDKRTVARFRQLGAERQEKANILAAVNKAKFLAEQDAYRASEKSAAKKEAADLSRATRMSRAFDKATLAGAKQQFRIEEQARRAMARQSLAGGGAGAGGGGGPTTGGASSGLMGAALMMRGGRGLSSSLYAAAGAGGGAMGLAAGVGVAVAATYALVDGLEKVMSVGMSMASVFPTMASAWAQGLWKVVEAGGAVEGAVLRLKMLGGFTKAQAMAAVAGVQEIVKFTPYMEEEVMKLTTTLAIAKVPMEGFLGRTLTLSDAAAQGISKVDQEVVDFAGTMKVTATSAILDYAAATGNVGERFKNFTMGMQRLLSSGQMRMLQDNLLAPDFLRLKKVAGKGATVIMEEFSKIVAERGMVGFGAAASTTFEGIVSNFKELPLIFAKGIADYGNEDGPYAKLKKGMLGVYKAIGTAIQDTGFLKSVRNILSPFIEGTAIAAVQMAKLVSMLVNFVKNHPGLVKIALTITLITAVITSLTGVVMVLGGALGIVAVVVGVFAATVIGLMPFMWPLVIVLGAIGATLGIVTGIFGTAAVTSEKFRKGVMALITGLSEAFQTWDKGKFTLSDEALSGLVGTGQMETFATLVEYARFAQRAIEGAITAMQEVWAQEGGKIAASAENLVDSFLKLLEALTGFGPVTGATFGQADGAADGFTNKIIRMTKAISELMDVASGFLNILTKIVNGYDKVAAVGRMFSVGGPSTYAEALAIQKGAPDVAGEPGPAEVARRESSVRAAQLSAATATTYQAGGGPQAAAYGGPAAGSTDQHGVPIYLTVQSNWDGDRMEEKVFEILARRGRAAL